MTRVVRALCAAAVVFPLVAAPGEAAERYVAPLGSPSAPCSEQMPCDLATGVNGASNADEVIVTSGDYGSPGSPETDPIASGADIDVHGIDGQPRPMLHTQAGVGFSLSNAGATLTHFGITSYDDNGGALSLSAATADRVYADGGSSSAVEGCVLGSGATLRNSVCVSGGFAVETSFGGATLRGVTAWSDGSFSYGLDVKAGTVTVQSSILRGSSADIHTTFAEDVMPPQVVVSYSNYDSVDAGGGGTVTPPGSATNQTEAPLLVNPAIGDFHQQATSPTVDMGAPGSVAVTGPFDIDGGPRTTGEAPDIGADEIAPPPSTGGPGSGGPGPGDPGPGNTGDGDAPGPPSIDAFGLSASAFVPFLRGGSVLLPSAARGTRVFYELSERATVGFRVQRKSRGRRVGRRCVRPTRRNLGRSRCVRWVRVRGGFSHSGAAGLNSFRFSGRVGGRALRPSRYRLVATPVDLAGNRGSVARRAFRILRRRR